MKQTKALLVTILLTLSVHAGWKQVKTLEHYGPKSFTLKDTVSYVELRRYQEYTSYASPSKASKASKTVSTSLRIYRDSSPHYERVFKRMPIKKSASFKKGEYGGLGGGSSWYYNGFMLDNARKTWRLENVKDVIDMIRPIDTPAEISLVLWLNGDAQDHAVKYRAKYHKSGKGYLVKEHYIFDNSVYGCGDYTYQYKISRSGKITQKRRISKKAIKDCGAE